MNVSLTKADLVSFEKDIANCFMQKEIKAPIHLSGGNEEQLIRVFREHVQPEDWIGCSWRSHLHCLLKGVPASELRKAILDGKSISLCFPEYKIISSAIVGGIVPIAVGIAMGIKRKGEQSKRKVVCFVGDMTAMTGAFREAARYARNFDLPVLFVVEDNGVSVESPTQQVWNSYRSEWPHGNVISYTYTNAWPHCGVGRFVNF